MRSKKKSHPSVEIKKISVSSFNQCRKRFNPELHITPQKQLKKSRATADHQMFVPIKIQHKYADVSLDKQGEGIALFYPNRCYLHLGKGVNPQVILWPTYLR